MSNPITFCDQCYALSHIECEDLTFAFSLSATTDYKTYITNHFGQVYEQDVISDADGTIELDHTKYPDGFFNPFSGFYTLTITDEDDIPVEFTVGYTTYECAIFDIYTQNDAN